MIRELIDHMDRLTLAMTHATSVAKEQRSDDAALGALVDMQRVIDQVDAMNKTIIALHAKWVR